MYEKIELKPILFKRLLILLKISKDTQLANEVNSMLRRIYYTFYYYLK